MKVLKYLLIFLFIIILTLFALLKSERALDFAAKKVLAQTGLDISYKTLKGDVFSGLSLTGINYKNQFKADFVLKVDFPAVTDGIVHIEKIKATNIWIDEKFLQSLIENNSSKEEPESKGGGIDQIKAIVIDDIELSLLDTKYQQYHIEKFNLHTRNLRYDMKEKIDGNIDLALQSNVAALEGEILLKESHYNGHFTVDARGDFVNRLLQDANLTLLSDPHLTADLEGNLQQSDFELRLNNTQLQYQKYKLENANLALKGNYDFESMKLDTTGNTVLVSNVADMNATFKTEMQVDDLNNTLVYTLHADISGVKAAFAELLQEQNLTFVEPSAITADVQGDMQKINAVVSLKGGEIHYADYILQPKKTDIKAEYDLKEAKLVASAQSDIHANVADFDLNMTSSVDLDDINHTLKLDLTSNLLPEKNFVAGLLAEQNITLQKIGALHIDVHTKEEMLVADVLIEPFAFEVDEFSAKSNESTVHIRLHTPSRKLDFKLLTALLSNAADITLDANSSLNLRDINGTLRYAAKSTLRAKEDYLKKKLHEKRVDFKRISPLTLQIKGDAKVAKADLDLRGRARVGRHFFKTDIKNTSVLFEIPQHRLKSDINAIVNSTIADVKIKTHVRLDLDDINNTLRYKALLHLHQKEVIEDINLTQLGEMIVDANGSLKNLDAKLRSQKINATVKSSDFNKFDFSLNTRKLYLDKLYLSLPPELKKSYAALEAKGFYALHEKKADVALRLKSLRLADRYIKTNRFRMQLDGEDFSLTPLKLEAKGFLMTLSAKSKDGAVEGHLKNRAVTADVKFQKEPLFADANVEIPSLKKLFREIDKVYPLGEIPKIDGALSVKAAMAGTNRVKVELRSPEIRLEEMGRIEHIDLLAYYTPERIDIPTFRFDMRKFKPKEMNRDVRLAYPAYIIMNGEDMKVDFALKNFLTLKAEKKGDLLVGEFQTKKLFLGLEGYGKTKITSNIHIYQTGKQKAISGDVELEETEITYESRVLDVSADPDIIIIRKEKKKKAADDDFFKNTFLDLHIKSKDEIEYKVEAGTVVVKPDIEIRKDFGAKMKLLGKVNILEGEYDFGDKRFQIKEGAIAFRGLEEINPHLDIHVEYPIDEVLIYIDILGDKRKPKLQFKSKPMMSKKDIFSYLLFGFAVSESDGAQSSAANAAEKIFGRALAKDLARELKLDRLDLTRNQLGGIDIKAGKKVGKKTIIYYQNKSLESSIIVERKLGKHFELDVEAGQSSQAVDLFYKKGFK